MRWLGVLALASACAVDDPVTPPESACDAIRAELPGVLDTAQTPGALVAFAQPGQPLCVVAAGASDETHAADVAQHYHIGSSTKTFVAATILLLDQEHAFDGKETVEAWLPGLVQNGNAISIAHLLTNTSGIANYLEIVKQQLDSGNPALYDVTTPTTPAQLVAISQSVGPRFSPGAQFEYSNTNWVLLGMIIEEATGKPWGDVVRERLLAEHQLEHTYIDRLAMAPGATLMRSWGPNAGVDSDITEIAHPTWASSAGSMVSTVEDMSAWTAALYTGQVIDGEQFDALMKPQITIGGDVGYSLGTITKPTQFGDWRGHGGDWVGSRTYMGGIPARGMFLQVATNYIDSDRFAVADVAWRIALGESLGSLAPFVGR